MENAEFERVMAERVELLIKGAQVVLEHIKGDISTIAINKQTGKKFLYTISKKELTEDEFNNINGEFDADKKQGANIIKDKGFDAYLRAQ